ncbi:MAG: hypothetical protein M1824_001690 [Vezdaea acicularis]|nr:MAG: hypothetical protein M1824_001690 [Vezdaea acicularis]
MVDPLERLSVPNGKRKLETSSEPSATVPHFLQGMLPNIGHVGGPRKSMKLGVHGDFKGKNNVTSKELVDEHFEGPELPPDEELEPEPDDEEGRFFGGGITNDTAEILDFMGEQGDAGMNAKKIDLNWLRRTALGFEKRITKNAELRAKFEDQPQKFMGSEADLDTDIKALSILSEHSELYAEFSKLGCVASLVNLLTHENTDIAIDVVEIIAELTDEDVEADQADWDVLVEAMVDAGLLDLLLQNLSRLNEENESDRKGVYHALNVFENLASSLKLVNSIGLNTSLLNWLLGRIHVRESPIGQNKQYAAELLAVLLQFSSPNRMRFIELNGIDISLQLLSSYRKRDPAKGTEEEEFGENLFDCVTCALEEIEGKQKFVEAEGVELCLIMLREGRWSKPRALRLLDHALGGHHGVAACQKLVEALGLKTIFAMFMKKQDSQTTEHILGILASLLRLLPATSTERIRTLAKCVEKDYEKIERLVKMRNDFVQKLERVDEDMRLENGNAGVGEFESNEDERLSRRLDAGLFSLQMTDIILAWLIAEDDGAKKKIRLLLGDQDDSFKNIRSTLQGESHCPKHGFILLI